MRVEEGDILLVTKYGDNHAVPVTPDGDVYGDVLIKFADTQKPHHKDEGDIFTLQITQTDESEVEGEWYTDSYLSHDIIHRDWIDVLRQRGELDHDPLSHTSEDTDLDEIETTTDSQEARGETETTNRDTWTDTKSDVMSNLNNS